MGRRVIAWYDAVMLPPFLCATHQVVDKCCGGYGKLARVGKLKGGVFINSPERNPTSP